MDNVTSILAALDRGDAHAAERLLPLIYDAKESVSVHLLFVSNK
jgi:hypothetical protein